MDPKRRRKFTVLDAMVLIAAVGVGLVWMREFTETEAGGESYPYETKFNGGPIPSPVRAVMIGFWWMDASHNIAAPVTIALVMLRAFPPRPNFRRLARQPGVVACVAVTAAVSVENLAKFSDVVVIVRYAAGKWSEIASLAYWNVQGDSESLAVFVAWLLLAWSGRWKRERSWVDHLGLIFGVYWLVMTPLHWLINGIIITLIWMP